MRALKTIKNHYLQVNYLSKYYVQIIVKKLFPRYLNEAELPIIKKKEYNKNFILENVQRFGKLIEWEKCIMVYTDHV